MHSTLHLILLLFSLLFLIQSLPVCVHSEQHQVTIAGGREATLGELPYAVGLKLKRLRYVYCGGAILSDRYIITAAHCFDNDDARSMDYRDPSTLEVVIGRVNLDDTVHGGIYEVKRIMKHEQYNSNTLVNDIAIIEIKTTTSDSTTSSGTGASSSSILQLYGNHVQVAMVENDSDRHLSLGMIMTLNGWGYMNRAQSELPRVMRTVQVPLVQGTNCLVHGQFNTQSMLCAGLGLGQDSCAGDSGGAMTYFDSALQQWIVAGIVSFGGAPCGSRGVLGTYTKVSHYVPWIQTTVPDLNMTHPFRPTPTPSESPPTPVPSGEPEEPSPGPSPSPLPSPSSSSSGGGEEIFVDLSNVELPEVNLPMVDVELIASAPPSSSSISSSLLYLIASLLVVIVFYAL